MMILCLQHNQAIQCPCQHR